MKTTELDAVIKKAYGASLKSLFANKPSVFPRFWPVRVTRSGAVWDTEERLGISDWSVPMKKLYRVVISKSYVEGGLIHDYSETDKAETRQFFIEGDTVLDVLRRLVTMVQLGDQQRVEITRYGELLKEEPDA